MNLTRLWLGVAAVVAVAVVAVVAADVVVTVLSTWTRIG